jgi:Zn finger protein HypA/HybF involved in hydrogenase expression
MSRYPRAVRDAKIKCLECNAPVAETIDERFVCVDCGRRIRDGLEVPSDGR